MSQCLPGNQDQYPLLIKPYSITCALKAEPPELPEPALPPAPVLKNLPRPSEPGEFTQAQPTKISINGLIVGVVSVALLTVFLQIGGFVLGASLLGAWLAWSYTTYPNRLLAFRQDRSEHEESVRQYPRQLEAWGQACAVERQRFDLEQMNYQQVVDRIQQEHQRKVNLIRTPQRIAEVRKRALQEALRQTQTYDGTDSDAPRGWAEYPKNCSFGPCLRRYFPGKIHVSLMVGYRTPDFAYIDENTGLHIDIEIDEPYTPRQYPNGGQLQVTHCIGDDDDRDSFFSDLGWVVLHFSEQQVIQAPDSCCKEVATVISLLTEDASVMKPFARVADLPRVARWTEEEALQMASRRVRLNYTR